MSTTVEFLMREAAAVLAELGTWAQHRSSAPEVGERVSTPEPLQVTTQRAQSLPDMRGLLPGYWLDAAGRPLPRPDIRTSLFAQPPGTAHSFRLRDPPSPRLHMPLLVPQSPVDSPPPPFRQPPTLRLDDDEPRP